MGHADATQLIVDDVLTGPGRAAAATADTPPTANSYGCTVLAEENRARCDTPRLPVGATWQVTITVLPTGPGAVTGQVTAGSAELKATGTEAAAVTSTVGGSG